MLLKTDLYPEKKLPYEKRLTKRRALIPSLEEATGYGLGSSRHMADSGCQFFFPRASLICDKAALKAVVAFFTAVKVV